MFLLVQAVMLMLILLELVLAIVCCHLYVCHQLRCCFCVARAASIISVLMAPKPKIRCSKIWSHDNWDGTKDHYTWCNDIFLKWKSHHRSYGKPDWGKQIKIKWIHKRPVPGGTADDPAYTEEVKVRAMPNNWSYEKVLSTVKKVCTGEAEIPSINPVSGDTLIVI